MESLLSAGIDVGTTTTQVAFSRLFMENTAGYFSVPRVSIVEKRVVYQGEPRFTPLLDAFRLDAEGVKAIVEEAYAKAGISPRDVRAGAVIITGEAARKENAEALVTSLAGLAGEFVVSAAGPDMESVVAGKGCGACAYSKARHCRVLSVDVGGGTSNAALFEEGEALSTGCVDIGGRLVRTDGQGTVLSFSPAAEQAAKAAGVGLYPGLRDQEALERLCAAMAGVLAQMAGLVPKTALYEALRTPGSARLDMGGGADALCFSGGVADAIEGRFGGGDDFRFGDIGILLGRAIANDGDLGRLPRIRPAETLRATVIGAGSYTVAVSGSTIAAAAEALPLKNLPVARCTPQEEAALFQGRDEGFGARFRGALALAPSGLCAMAFAGKKSPSYAEVRAMGGVLAQIGEESLAPGAPLVAVCERDMAKALGGALRGRTGRPVLSIDGVAAAEGDQLDIGKPVMGGLAVPVVVKTLVFER